MLADEEVLVVKIVLADRTEDALLRQLFEFYLYDMSEWFGFDSSPNARYDYATEKFWRDEYRVYLAFQGEVPIGFALVTPVGRQKDHPGARDVEEFFIARRYRRTGLGVALASHIWDDNPGGWLVRVFQENRPALPFWRTVIADYTDNQFAEEVVQIANGSWSHFTFNNAR